MEGNHKAGVDARFVFGLLIGELPVDGAFNLTGLLQELQTQQRCWGQGLSSSRSRRRRGYRGACAGDTLLESRVVRAIGRLPSVSPASHLKGCWDSHPVQLMVCHLWSECRLVRNREERDSGTRQALAVRQLRGESGDRGCSRNRRLSCSIQIAAIIRRQASGSGGSPLPDRDQALKRNY